MRISTSFSVEGKQRPAPLKLPKRDKLLLLPYQKPKKRKLTTKPNPALKVRKTKSHHYTGRVGSKTNSVVKDLKGCRKATVKKDGQRLPITSQNGVPHALELINTPSTRSEVNIDITRQDYQLTDIDIDLGLALVQEQWKDVKAQSCLNIQRPKKFDQAVYANHGSYAQIFPMKETQH